MKPFNPGGHAAYQERVLTQLRKYYPDAVSSLPASTWDILEKFWALDLSELDSLMQDRYSVFGPAPRLPSDMLRSLLLSVEFKVSSYTKWAADLKENHLHAILSGFFIGDTPGTGTFYDFLGLCGSLTRITFLILPIPRRKSPKSRIRRAAKLLPLKKSRSKTFSAVRGGSSHGHGTLQTPLRHF